MYQYNILQQKEKRERAFAVYILYVTSSGHKYALYTLSGVLDI